MNSPLTPSLPMMIVVVHGKQYSSHGLLATDHESTIRINNNNNNNKVSNRAPEVQQQITILQQQGK
jgi:hypothetical protein